MTEKFLPPAGGKERHDEPGFPESRAITAIDFRGEKLSVHEGLGPNKDIIVIGPKPDEIMYPRKGCMYTPGGRRFFTTSRVGHADAAANIKVYLFEKGMGIEDRRKSLDYSETLPSVEELVNDSVRVDVSFDGPSLTFTVDMKGDDEQAKDILSVLTGSGVDKSKIRFDPARFRAR